MAYDTLKQQSFLQNGARMEVGYGVTILTISEATFKVPTKLRKVRGGFGVMLKDGIVAIPTAEVVTGGMITFTRIGTISQEGGSGQAADDTVSYTVFGD